MRHKRYRHSTYAEVSDSVQNRIWFNLARLRYEQGFHDQARDLLARISDSLPDSIEAERKYLLTNLYLGNGQYDEAADLSNTIDAKSIWKIYARYNLGVSVIENGDYDHQFNEGKAARNALYSTHGSFPPVAKRIGNRDFPIFDSPPQKNQKSRLSP